MAPNGFAGTWRLNLDRSDIPPVTRSQVLFIDTDGIRIEMREELVNDKGETLVITVQGRLDGHDYPLKGTPFADTVSYRLLNSRTMEGIAKFNGRVRVKERAVLSECGDTVSVTYLSYDDHGNIQESHGLFERQETP